MNKRIFSLSLILIGVFGTASAQSVQKTEHEISIQDLKPQINYKQSDQSDPFYQPIQEKSGLALASSAIIPGSGQAANKKWIRAGAYFFAEAVFLGVHLKSYYDARDKQRRYEQFADNNWSVVNYAQWLVNYHEQNNLQNEYIEDLRTKVDGLSADYNPQKDWDKVDLELLRQVERHTPFVYPDQIGKPFSHEMPDYGSQQYYELISKYYQYGSGWNDFGYDRDGNKLDSRYKLNWDGSAMPLNFMRGATMAEEFNDSYRLAGNMVSLIILNHIVSAFDAFLTVKIKNNRLNADTNLLHPHRTFSLKFHF